MLKVIFICFCALYGFLYFIFAVTTKLPFKTILFYSFLGLAGVIAVNLSSAFSGVYIPVNFYTIGTASVLGIPGTISLLILRIIFM
jgi:hypothetical protein